MQSFLAASEVSIVSQLETVSGSRFRVKALGFRILDLGFRVPGLGFRERCIKASRGAS